MIKANELRRGNKVSYYKPRYDKPVIDTVIGVLPVEEYGGVDCAYLQNYSPVNIDSLISIPLTPEILKSCGFMQWVKHNIYSLDFKNGNSIQIIGNKVFLGGGESYILGHGFTLEIKYLHQLQNLYVVLTGEELKINLNVIA